MNNDITTDSFNKNLNVSTKQITLKPAEEYSKKLEIYHRLDNRFPRQHMCSETRTTAPYGGY